MARWEEEELEEHIRTSFVYEIILNRKFYYKLDFPPTSFFTPEIVRMIKAIPNEEIVYSGKDIACMHRILENLKYLYTHAGSLGLGDSLKNILTRKKWVEDELANIIN